MSKSTWHSEFHQNLKSVTRTPAKFKIHIIMLITHLDRKDENCNDANHTKDTSTRPAKCFDSWNTKNIWIHHNLIYLVHSLHSTYNKNNFIAHAFQPVQSKEPVCRKSRKLWLHAAGEGSPRQRSTCQTASLAPFRLFAFRLEMHFHFSTEK